MTSDFTTILDGFLQYKDDVWQNIKELPEVKEEIKLLGERKARRCGSVLDVSSDGYYNAIKCIEDFEKVSILHYFSYL